MKTVLSDEVLKVGFCSFVVLIDVPRSTAVIILNRTGFDKNGGKQKGTGRDSISVFRFHLNWTSQ